MLSNIQGPRRIEWPLITYTIILASAQLFTDLGEIPIRLWDESRQAINTIEMSRTGALLVVTFDGQPDLWNTKPPLLIWLQLISTQLFGFYEWSFRLPSAIAGLVTSIVTGIFTLKLTKSYVSACLAVLCLISIGSYVGFHGTRTGDYDSLLTLWTSLYCFSFIAFIRTNKTAFLYLFTLFVILAVYTKGIAGLLFLPGILIILTLFGNFGKLFTHHTLIAIQGAIILIFGFYLIRESLSPGYLEAVWNNEIGGRYGSALEQQSHPINFYFKMMANEYLSYYVIILLGVVLSIHSRMVHLIRPALCLLILWLSFLLIISSSQTKLTWYIIPIFPLIAVLFALSTEFIIAFARNNIQNANTFIPKMIIYLSILLLVGVNAYRTFSANTNYREHAHESDIYDIGYLIQKASRGQYNLQGAYICFSGYRPNTWADLYIASERGLDIPFKSVGQLEKGDKVFLWQANLEDELNSLYQATLYKTEKDTKFYEIDGRKTD